MRYTTEPPCFLRELRRRIRFWRWAQPVLTWPRRLQALLAWADVLRRVDLDSIRDVFPIAPPQRDFSWAWRLASSFFRLQTQLTEGGLVFPTLRLERATSSRKWALAGTRHT